MAWVDVCLDAGHGGHDPGHIALGRRPEHHEKQLALALALSGARALERRGYTTLLTRSDDRFLTLGARARIANGELPNDLGEQARSRLFVSLHLNGSSPEVTGTETYWSEAKQWARHRDAWRADSIAANALHAALAEAIPHAFGPCSADRGVRAFPFQVLRDARCAAALIEMGFVTNACQLAALSSPASRERLGEGLAAGVALLIEPGATEPFDARTAYAGPVRRSERWNAGATRSREPRRPRPAPLFEERFEHASFPPRGWSTTPESVAVHGWRLDAPARAATVPAERPGARDAWLVSPACVPNDGATLTFAWSGNRRWAGGLDVDCRVLRRGAVDGAVIWTLRGERPGLAFAWRRRELDLSPFKGEPVRIAFRVRGDHGADFSLDDVAVFPGSTPAMPVVARRELARGSASATR